MNKADTDLYTGYLLSTLVASTVTWLSAVVEEEISHDQVTGFDITVLNELYQVGGELDSLGC